MEVIIYIGFRTLDVKCTQYGVCGEVAFKNARAMVFSKSGGADISFRSGSEVSKKNSAGLPQPSSDTP
jgi:hypothetical protein